MLLLLATLGLFWAVSCSNIDLEKPPGLARGRVEVKAFVEEDLPLYHNLALTYFPGVDPELVLLNYAYQELARVDLMPMTRKEINDLLLKLGFYKKENLDAEVPANFYYAPMTGKPVRQLKPQARKHIQAKTEDLMESDDLKQDL